MKKIIISSFVGVLAFVLIGCDSGTKDSIVNTNANMNRAMNTMANQNTIIVTNANANTRMDADDDWDADLTREEYDKDRAKYESRAEKAGSTIGSGANDLWLWTKTRSALATTDDLRDSTINVDVENAVVTLKGTVGSAAQKAAAVKVAKGIEGVTNVKDMLQVKPGDSMTNQAVTDDKDMKSNTNMNKK